jgi:hypothetical protein
MQEVFKRMVWNQNTPPWGTINIRIMTTSARLTTEIVMYLNLNGFNAWRNNTTGIWDAKQQIFRKNPSQKKGVSDIIGFRKSDGRHIEVEIKIGKDKESMYQILHHEDLNKGHCIAIVAKTFHQFETDLKLKNL